LSQKAWAELLHARPDLREAYRSVEGGVTDASDIWHPEMEQAVQKGQTIRSDRAGDGEKLTVAIPIKVRGNVIGVLDTYKPGAAGDWTPEEVALLETLTEQLGTALESARLYEDTQRGAARERLSAQITAHMRETLDVDVVLQTAVREISAALGLVALDVRLGAEAETTQDGVPSLSEQ